MFVALRLLCWLLVAWPWQSRAGSCPGVCACKWKGGKRTVECLERALIAIPENVDSDTQVLDVSGNNLQTIPRETFYKANLTNLQRMYLRSCRIGQIGERAFRGLTNLVELDLSHNLLTAVPSAALEDTPFVRYLSLASNPIRKIEADAFGTVTGVAKIDLSHCEIRSISPNAFERLEHLEWLKLNGNRLTELLPRTVETMSELHGVELHENPWSCDCRLRAAKQWLALDNLPHAVAPACSGPERLAGRTFAELSLDDFACRPELLPASRYVEAVAGENATVACRVGSVPSASVHWYWNGRLLLNNSAFGARRKVFIFEEGGFEKTSTMVLTGAVETDSGDFHCVAENRAGSAEANFTLRVSPRTADAPSLTGGRIVGLGIALLLLSAVVAAGFLILFRLRRLPFSEGKNRSRSETVAETDGSELAAPAANAKSVALGRGDVAFIEDSGHVAGEPVGQPFAARRFGADGGSAENGSFAGGPSSAGNNPDFAFRARAAAEPLARLVSPDSPRHRRIVPEEVETGTARRRPIAPEEGAELRSNATTNANDYPPDYGLPIFEETVPEGLGPALAYRCPPAFGDVRHLDAKTIRVWQKGVPVLPPATALDQVRARPGPLHEACCGRGCGTDV